MTAKKNPWAQAAGRVTSERKKQTSAANGHLGGRPRKDATPSGARRVQLVAASVNVLCPFCGEPQPAPDGSEQWLHEYFNTHSGIKDCVSCDAKILIAHDAKVQFS